MDRSSRQKVNKEIVVLNETLDQMDLIDLYRTFHPNAAECTFSLSAHGTFSRIDHMIRHKTNLSDIKKFEIISNIFCYHNVMKLEINYKKKAEKIRNMGRLNNMILNYCGSTKKSKEESKITRRQKKMKIQHIKIYVIQQKQYKEGSLYQYRPISRNKKYLK